ncbi:MAG: radical SAM protein [Prevotellaceae bacterium]|nr:radical SAM protein [Prevotellaceae bacterium]
MSFSYILSYFGVYLFNKFYPAFISVEPADFCQLACPECPVGNGKSYSKRGRTLSLEHFKESVDELKETLVHVIFYFQGEPLLNRNLTEMIAYTHRAGIYTSTSTNAQLIDERTAEKLVQSGLDKLIVSIDGTTQATYEKYRIGGKLEKAVNAVKLLVAAKKRSGRTNPIIEIQFLVLKTNEHQLDEIKKLTKETGADRLSLKSAQLYDFENGHELLTTIDRYARYKKGKEEKWYPKNKWRNHCLRLWSGAVVTINGEVLPCCFDKESAFSFGNIHEKSFYACWTSPKAMNFRKRILKNRKQFDICRNCSSKK